MVVRVPDSQATPMFGCGHRHPLVLKNRQSNIKQMCYM
jgi:hypothetical protein